MHCAALGWLVSSLPLHEVVPAVRGVMPVQGCACKTPRMQCNVFEVSGHCAAEMVGPCGLEVPPCTVAVEDCMQDLLSVRLCRLETVLGSFLSKVVCVTLVTQAHEEQRLQMSGLLGTELVSIST
jgi:hypothetical protein